MFGLLLPAQKMMGKTTIETNAPEQKIEYILFHLETCPHCQDEIKFLNKKLLPKYGEFIDLKMYEVSDEKNSDIFRQYGVYHNVEVGSVPMTIIDGEIITGYGTDKTTGAQIMNLIEKKLVEKGLITIPMTGTEDKQSNILLYGGIIIFSMIMILFIIKKYKNNEAISI